MPPRVPLGPEALTGISYACMGLKELHNTFLMTQKRPFMAPYCGDLVWVAEVEGKLTHGFGLRSAPAGKEFVRLDSTMQAGRISQTPLFKMEQYGEWTH